RKDHPQGIPASARETFDRLSPDGARHSEGYGPRFRRVVASSRILPAPGLPLPDRFFEADLYGDVLRVSGVWHTRIGQGCPCRTSLGHQQYYHHYYRTDRWRPDPKVLRLSHGDSGWSAFGRIRL